MLLVGAGLLLRSFVQLVSVDPGYDPANVLTARVGNPGIDNPFLAGPMTIGAMAERRASSRRFYAALLDRLTELERLPAIEAVGVSSGIPFGGGGRGVARLRVAGRPEPADGAELPEVRVQTVGAGYFRTIRLRVLSGRALTRLDAAGAPRAVVVNETLVREHLDRAAAVGQRLLFGRDDEPWRVVGVVADVEYQDLAATGSMGEIYVSVSQSETASVINLNDPFVSVRASGDPVASLPFLREAVADVHPRAPLDDVMTMDARLSGRRGPAARVLALRRVLRGAGSVRRGGRVLRPAQPNRVRAAAGNRRPDGPRRTALRRACPRRPPGGRTHSGRNRPRPAGGRRLRSSPGEPSVRCRRRRPTDLPRRPARAGGRRHGRLLAAGTSGGPIAPDGRPACRIACLVRRSFGQEASADSASLQRVQPVLPVPTLRAREPNALRWSGGVPAGGCGWSRTLAEALGIQA